MAITLEPPPTVNHLDRRERMRLVRSNRKLEAVLGAVPYYLEPTSQLDAPKANRREGRIFDSPASSSTSSTLNSMAEKPSQFKPLKTVPKSKQAPRALELSRPLLLRLRSLPVPPSSNRARQSSISSRRPSIAPVSPLSPTFTIDLEKLQSNSLKTRRKKMAKLTRTLGENVPPELVFPSNANATGKHIKSRSLEDTHLPPSSSSNSEKPRPIISRPRAMSSRSRSRPKIPPVPSNPPPTPAVHIHLPPAQTDQAKPTLAERRRKPRPRSLSVPTGTDMLITADAAQSHREDVVVVADAVAPIVLTVQTKIDVYRKLQCLTVDEKATKDIFESYSPPPFHSVESLSPPTPMPSQPHTKSASTSSVSRLRSTDVPSAFRQFGKRKELGWSGEWNQDMGNVVKNLRNLKAR